MAVPVGVGSAIYLVEYAPRGNRFVQMVRITAETLQGIPSIIYGLFGMLFFVTALKWGLSLMAGACTLAIMVLPVIMRTTEEALLAVPDAYREGGFGLGAGRLRTVFPVSYTHLDVYKRQDHRFHRPGRSARGLDRQASWRIARGAAPGTGDRGAHAQLR